MNTVLVLAILLFILMRAVGGRKGAKSFVALFMNFVVLVVTVLFMSHSTFDLLVLTVLACTAISWINLFFVNGVSHKTMTAFLSTWVTIILMIPLILFVTRRAMIQGFPEEEMHELNVFSFYVGIDFIEVATAVILMSTIGAIIDIAISISSPMNEIIRQEPSISRKRLFEAGMGIGRDILGTSVNTLLFAFLGSYMALLIWFLDLNYTFGEMVNAKVFSAETITILSAGIGLTVVIPITCAITAVFLDRARNKDGTGMED
ncbi:YibE/F family protein [Salisediminibacterium selenitireducens]|uniref:YibE/F family protein n=1 Tax=Bacillus selenitireducens (strain ATCC 700615 / DSM 15326 / MLS10) TaxID=439292 RepID=D6XWF5_BACIE|nr:YibE/F family protein [Salisediminibacterium selenitireducens]ADH97797.1 YibE/F family protein [[Bacillus] selenitireducens MLS10]